jgi:hypothetical protein
MQKAAVPLMALTVFFFSCGCDSLLNWTLGHPHQDKECIERGKAYDARVEKLKRDAGEILKVGTKKDVVVRFFQDHEIPPEFVGNEVTGTIHLKGGCPPPGCGSEDALLGLRVPVDKEGTVIANPAVGALFTDCL